MFINRLLRAVFILLILHASNTFAQSNYDKLIEKQEFEKIFKKLSKKYEKEPNDVYNNFDFSVFYNVNSNPRFNTDTAFLYAKRAEKFYNGLDAKEKEKLAKKDLNEDSIRLQIVRVCQSAFTIAREKHTLADYDYFIIHYPDYKETADSAVALRNSIAFKDAEGVNTVRSFQEFIDKYPDATEIPQAKKQRNALAFALAKNKNTFESFDDFIQTYRDADEIAAAIKLRDTRAFEIAEKKDSSAAFISFLLAFPKSHLKERAVFKFDSLLYLEKTKRNDAKSHIDFLKAHKESKYYSFIEDSIYFISRDNQDFYGLKFCVEEIKDPELLDSAWLHYYRVYTADGFPASYTSFKKKYENFPYKEKLEEDYRNSLKIASIVDNNGFNPAKNDEFKEYLKTSAHSDMAFILLQLRLEKYIKAKNWRSVLNLTQTYRTYFGNNNRKYNNLIEILSDSDKSIKPVPIIGAINTPMGGEYVPVITANNKYLYFCGFNRSDNIGGEDVYVSKNVNGYWKQPEIIKELSTFYNDAPLSVSTDGNEMLLFKNSDLYYSTKTADGWSDIVAFPEPINSDEWEADAMRTSDGKALLFVSKREGGHNYTTKDADIYVCLKTDSGWSEAINLGPTINTRFMDRSPFLHPDMKTLYFASAGHGGLGNLDLFKSTRLNDTLWTEWSQPVNMGKEINSAGADWGYRISTDGEKAYFSKMNSKEINDIYTLDIPIHLRPNFVATISGTLIDRDSIPIEATIRWEDLATHKMVGESKSNPKDGSFFIVLPLGRMYGYYVDKEGFFPVSNNIDLRKAKKAIEITEDIKMPTFKQMKEEALAVPVNNLFFNTNSSRLLRESYPELKRVVEIIKQHNFKVEIAGHTDNTGTVEHNQQLSEERAASVKEFLVSKGISETQIVTVGFGDTKPVATNETSVGKAKNRRVEMRLID